MSYTSKLLLLLFFLFLLRPSIGAAAATGFRTALTHVDSAGNYTVTELLRRAVQRSTRRALSLQKATARSSNVEAFIHASDLEYLMDLAIGTPALAISAIADTGSDLIWTQCAPCADCFPQPTPIYDSSASSTFSKLPCTDPLCPRGQINSTACTGFCNYFTSYGDNSNTSGVLAVEVFTFGLSDQGSSATLDFGCSSKSEGDFANSTGIVGLGRGPLSLVSQLNASRFSYCLAPFTEGNVSSPFLLGSLAELNSSSDSVQSTPIILNPAHSSFYYLSLIGISVGNILLPIPNTTFEIKADGTGGLIIDSGSSITTLEQSSYAILREEIVSLVNLTVSSKTNNTDLDLCFSLPATAGSPPEMPDLIFHFDAGADMTLPRDNYMAWDPASGLFCLAISGQSDSFSILGNYQQQDMHVLFDLDAGMLSFVPAKCNEL